MFCTQSLPLQVCLVVTVRLHAMGGFLHFLQLAVVFSQQVRPQSHYLQEGRKCFIYGYMTSDIWLRTIPIVRKETRRCHIGYSFRLTARVLLYAPSHRQDSTYHGLCYTSWSTGWNKQ